MLNEFLLHLAESLEAQTTSQMLVSSYYVWSWVESAHVLTLILSVGCLFIIDLRILGWMLTDSSATEVAQRLHRPMILAFVVMFLTGALLLYAEPVATVQSLWFRLKILLIFVAGINAWIFNQRLKNYQPSCERAVVAPLSLRIGASLSLGFWCLIIVFGRYIAYDWVDCDNTGNTAILWASGCVYQLQAL